MRSAMWSATPARAIRDRADLRRSCRTQCGISLGSSSLSSALRNDRALIAPLPCAAAKTCGLPAMRGCAAINFLRFHHRHERTKLRLKAVHPQGPRVLGPLWSSTMPTTMPATWATMTTATRRPARHPALTLTHFANRVRSRSDRVSACFLGGTLGNMRPGVKMHVRPLAPRLSGVLLVQHLRTPQLVSLRRVRRVMRRRACSRRIASDAPRPSRTMRRSSPTRSMKCGKRIERT